MPSAAPSVPTSAPDSSDARQLFADGHAHRVQQRDLAPPSRDRQRLRRVDEEGAREERHEREGRQVGSIRARQPNRIVTRLARRRESHAGRQQRSHRILDCEWVRPRRQPQVHSIELAQPIEPPLRGADVEHAERLAVFAGRQQSGDPQLHRIERDLHVERIADLELEGLGRRRAQPDGILGQQPAALRGGGAGRGQRRLQFRRTERVDADQLQGAVPTRQSRLRLDHRTRHGDARDCGKPGEQVLVEAEPGRLHGQVRHAEQAARGELHLVRRDAIDQVDREPERDTERDRDDGEQRAAHGLAQRPDCRGIEQREPRAEAGCRRSSRHDPGVRGARACSPDRVSS